MNPSDYKKNPKIATEDPQTTWHPPKITSFLQYFTFFPTGQSTWLYLEFLAKFSVSLYKDTWVEVQKSIILVRILSTASPFPPRVLKKTLKIAIYPQRESTVFCFSSLMLPIRFHGTAEATKTSSSQKPNTLPNMILCLLHHPLWTNSTYESVK